MKILPNWLQSIIKYFSSSISKKIVTPYALLTLVLAAMGVFVITQLVATSFEDRLKNQLLEAGRVVSDEVVNRERIRLEIERVVANTKGMADAVVDNDTTTLNELVSPVIANTNSIDSIIVVNTQGREIIRFQRLGKGVNFSIETIIDSNLDFSSWPAAEKVLNDPEGAKEVQFGFVDPELNELLIYTIGPIRNADSETVGAVLVGNFLNSELTALHNVALANLTLFNQNGDVLGTTFALDEAQQEQVFSIFDADRYRQVMEAGDVTLLDQIVLPENSLNIANRNYRLAYAPFVLRGRGVGVYAVALPTDFITNTTNQSRNLLIALFSFGVATVFGIGYFIARRITIPVLRLVKTSQAISAGDLDQRTGISSNDEIGILAAAFDDMTTELQRLLQLQAEEASKLNAILNSIADGVIVQDTNDQIIVKNPAAEKILNEIGQSFIESSTMDGDVESIDPIAAEQYTKFFLNSLTGLEFKEAERFEMGDQVLSALSAPVITNEERLGSVVVLRDITREVESEKLKDDFITSASHELKTPLTAIKGYTTILQMMAQMNTDQPMADKQIENLAKMEKEITDLDNIIQSMLDLSQIDANQLGIDQAPINLNDLLEREMNNWANNMDKRELSFNLILPNTEVWVAGDDKRLTRVVHNLIKNAHDYTPPAGKVEIALKQENGHGQVDVVDTGVGIKTEDQRFLFTKFYRAVHDESHFGDTSGVGLGLYTSRAIVEAHNGRLWMEESEVDKGSVFSFALPTINPDEFDGDDPAAFDWDD